MGVLNVTPDSFSDGGKYFSTEKAIAHGLRLVDEGADIIDVGGESTRPGAVQVSEEQECERVIPVIRALKKQTNVSISVDTRHVLVMKEAINAGVDIINDVSALSAQGAMPLVSQHPVKICLMHMQGTPEVMQNAPDYQDAVKEIISYLKDRVKACLQAGVKKENIWIDPGFGFGKKLEHNLALLAGLKEFTQLGLPILVGLSRKSMFGEILNKPVDQRLYASLAGAVIAALQGATIVRTHDVLATKDALAVVQAVKAFEQRRAEANVLPA
ncbi:MAG: dihydropteroate synthase [Proteobacteria bacterium]|nr:dihydropteroate synthase [Pseudomonadota bacterium]